MSNVLRALRRASILCALLLLPVASFAGFSISNGQLVDNNGTPFVMRGVNYPYTWYQSRPTQQDLAAIAATGANSVRFVLSTGGQWPRVTGAQVSQLIQWSKDNRMIAVLEVHDSTGWTESAAAVPISNATAYWTSSDIRAAINGQENFVIINIANEPFGNNTTANYTPDTIAAIQALRSAGLTHTLMVDAANWGQDWSNTMRSNAMQIWNADTRRNLVFSVHMYEVYAQASAVSSYMQAFDDMALPLVVGEFGADHQGQPVDEGAIMAEAQARGNGYIGWSWSGNGGCCVSLDIVSNFSTTLTSWGNTLVNGANGIRATSVLASVFGTPTNNLTVSPTSLSFASGASSSPVAVTANVSWTVTDNQTWLSAAPASGANNGSFTASATANTGTTSRTGTLTVTGGGITRTIAVTQAGVTANNLTVSPTSLSFGAAASSSPLTITSNVSWTVTDNQTWLSAAVASGTNNGTFNVIVTANTSTTSRSGTISVTGGGLARTIAVTQSGTAPSNFTVTAPGTAAITRGSNTTATVTLNRTSFPGSVTLSASGLPSGVTASFNPASTTGNSSTLTLTATATATLGTANFTITGTSGSTVRTATLALTVNAGGGGGAATAQALVTSSSGWFTEQQLRLSNTANITALSITIVVQRTTGVSASGQYNTVGGQIAQSNSSTASAITYVFTLNAGQSLAPANNRTFAVQMGGTGTVHPSAGDTYTVSYTSGGQNFTLAGHF